jgi:hypothetical protein
MFPFYKGETEAQTGYHDSLPQLLVVEASYRPSLSNFRGPAGTQPNSLPTDVSISHSLSVPGQTGPRHQGCKLLNLGRPRLGEGMALRFPMCPLCRTGT